ncbi:hypothetical protein Tco_1171763 [Tanacetum coccineum]
MGASKAGLVVEIQRISLTGFRICTSRSHYQSVSKQTTRISQVTLRKSLFDVVKQDFPSSHDQFKAVHSDVFGKITW